MYNSLSAIFMDYYKILGVEKSASQEDIKKAYRKLAHKHHPDKPGGDEKKFKEINEAYQILSNPQKKAQYDRFGRIFTGDGGFNYGEGNPFGGAQGGPFGFDFDINSFGDLSGNGDLGDIFDAFFEGLGIKDKRRTYRRGSDIELIQEITLEEAFGGVEKKIKYKANIKCGKCVGQGYDSKSGLSVCSVCGGRGEIKETRSTFFGNFSQVKSCASCLGTGQIPNKICGDCKGKGFIGGEKEAALKILPGIADNQIIKIKSGGNAGERGAEEGDLFIVVKIKPNQIFSRHGDDLVVNKKIKLADLLLNLIDEEKEIEIPKISGGIKKIKIPENFDLTRLLKISGEGMPHFNRSGRGDLLVKFSVEVPRRASAKIKKLIEELKKELE